MTEDQKWYIGGLFDADGCVYTGANNALVVSVTQAQKGIAAVQFLQEIFGGTITDRGQRTAAHQRLHGWHLCGQNAKSFCEIMHRYVFLKRDQLQLASQYPMNTTSRPVSGINLSTMEEHSFASLEAAVVFFGARGQTLHKAAISACLHGKAKQHGGFVWTSPEKSTEWKITKQMIASQLKILKTKPHKLIKDVLPDPYIAGFFDGDGCFSLTPKGVHAHRICQKYIAICDAFQKRFGGSVKLTREGYFTWNLYKGGLAFVQVVYPFLRGKAKQASLLLSFTRSSVDHVREQLRDLKGNHWRKGI